MGFEPLRVGELARRTGLTVRTLHHYDELGLLRPSLHSEAGHRL
jgi:DNA-binding transcriptional MerR regulator